MVECRWWRLVGRGLDFDWRTSFGGQYAHLRVIEGVAVVVVHHELADVLILGVSFCFFGHKVRKCASFLFGSKIVATGVQHLLGKASGGSIGAGVEVEINGVRAPAAEDLGDVFAQTGTEEGGGSPSAKRSGFDEFWWDVSAIFAAVGGLAQSHCKLACGDIGPAMFLLISSWCKVGV